MANFDASAMAGGSETPAPAGWYPTEAGQQYWDGAQWLANPPPLARSAQQVPGMPSDRPPATYGSAGYGALHPSGIPSSDRSTAMLAHLLTLVAGFLAPLIIYVTKKDESAFIRHHAAEALNLTLTVMAVSFGTMAVLFGGTGMVALVSSEAGLALFLVVYVLLFVVMFAVSIGALVITIMAGMAANRGEWYKMPFSFHWIK